MDYREKRDKAFEDGRDGKFALTVKEFMEIKIPEPQDGDTWGNWTFQQNNLTLQYRNSEHNTYEIDLEQLDGPLSVIIWQKHLSEKVFITAEDIGNLFFAIQDLSGAWWQPDTNIAKVIRAKYGKRAA